MSVAYVFTFWVPCCDVRCLCLYVLRSVLWCPLFMTLRSEFRVVMFVAYVFTFWVPCCDVRCLCLYVLSYVLWCPLFMSLRSEFRFVMSVVYVFTFWVPCCDVRCDFHIQTMFGSSLPPIVCRRVHVLFAYSAIQHILCCVVALFFVVLCTLCCQFLSILHFWLPLRYSLPFTWNLGLLHAYVIIRYYYSDRNYEMSWLFLFNIIC